MYFSRSNSPQSGRQLISRRHHPGGNSGRAPHGRHGAQDGNGTVQHEWDGAPIRNIMRQDTELYYEDHSYVQNQNGLSREHGGHEGQTRVFTSSQALENQSGACNASPMGRSVTYPRLQDDRYLYGTESEAPRMINENGDLVSESEGGAGGPAVYAGPADRSNTALREAILSTVHYPFDSKNGSDVQGGSASVTGFAESSKKHVRGTSAPVYPLPLQGNVPSNQGQHQQTNVEVMNKGSKFSNASVSNNKQTTHDVLATEGRIIEDAALHEQYSRVITPEMPPTEETEDVCFMLRKAMEEREKWVFRPAHGPEDLRNLPEAQLMSECFDGNPFHWDNMVRSVDIIDTLLLFLLFTFFYFQGSLPLRYKMVDGVVSIWNPEEPETWLFQPPGNSVDFFSTMHWLLKIAAMGHVRSFTHHRLQLLEQKFNLHVMLNADKEFLAQKSAPHRDFYNVRKVDTHVHHSACMHQKHLLRFIKSKLKKEPDELVIFRDGKFLTLKEVFESLNLTPYDLSVDTLDVHADKNIFHRFDKFNLKYNPFGQSRLREIFIKQENIIHGRFLAELTREVFSDLEGSKYQHTEYRISIYGRKPVEWDTLASWVVQNRLYSDNNRWMIQIPRLYDVYKAQGIIENYQQFLDNIFLPMFEATISPSSHPMLHIFLKHVSGFDLVDDESKPERRPTKHMPKPSEWNIKHNPPYAYYMYYIYANLYVLNRLRDSRGLNTFSLRPHCGEAGDLDHLAATYLLAENIAHGINLRKTPCLQYLYFTSQIGLCMSPLSNNSLFLDYHKNPFPQFFARGLSVSLSTDDPLQIHLTREPLVEEYSVAAQVWKLSATDLCEIARNSVLHSGFPHRLKMHWVHTDYWKYGPEGNNIQKTNVPALRMVFRKDCLTEEHQLIAHGAASHARRLEAKAIVDS